MPSPQFLDLYQSIENAAHKRSENSKPLPCPNFPKLPQKKSKARVSVVTNVAANTLENNNKSESTVAIRSGRQGVQEARSKTT